MTPSPSPYPPHEPDPPLPPPRRVWAAQTWREVAHLLGNLPMDLVGFGYVVISLHLSIALSFTVVGLPLLALSLLGCRRYGRLERARARALLRLRVADPSPLRARGDGVLGWLWTRLRDRVAWRHALYWGVRPPWAVLSFTATLCALVLAGPLLPRVVRGLTHVDRFLVRALLSPSDGLERRIAELESGRGVVVDTAAADLRRIERDLHDGAQARLVTLAMDLGLAREKLLHDDPSAAARLVGEAHDEAKRALQELRDLARGIHPAILTDRGLGPALSHLTSRCAVPVTLTVDLPHRPAPALEAIAYFTLSELLQNLAKHSGARTAHVDIWTTSPAPRGPQHLMLHVADDGRGGAAPGRGTGLTGLTERLRSVDGHLLVDSPPGGPTRITAQLPYRPAAGR